MTMEKVKYVLKGYGKYIICILLALLVGLAEEYAYNIPVKNEEQFIHLDKSKITFANVEVDEELKMSTGIEPGEVIIPIEKAFVDKLRFTCEGKTVYGFEAEIELRQYSLDGKKYNKVYRDNNNYVLQESIINVHSMVDRIIIRLPESVEGLKIEKMYIDNTGNFSIPRFGFYAIVTLLLSLLVVNAGMFARRIEYTFLFIALLFGGLLIIALPTQKVAMDEEIHFGRAFYLWETIQGKDKIIANDDMEIMYNGLLTNWPYHKPESEEESKQQIEYLDKNIKYYEEDNNPDHIKDNYKLHLYSIGYVTQSLLIQLGKLFKLPFSIVFRMGRLGNLLLYVLVIFFAIRHLKVGKRLMMVLGLMPTTLFSAVTYSYDATVTAFAMLGLSYFMMELYEDEQTLNYKNFIIFIVAIIIASMPKAVYAPFLLLTFLIPGKKFKTSTQKWIVKGTATVATLLMMSTFVIPAVSDPNAAGDSRGGDTNVGQQLTHIFTYPLAYTKLLLTSIKNTFFSFMVGKEGLGGMGHYSMPPVSVWITPFLGYVIATDHRMNERKIFNGWQKFLGCGLIFSIICFIWTSLYLSYTPVGATVINGVQGRYYTPLLVLFCYLLRNHKIENKITKKADTRILVLGIVGILAVSIFKLVIRNTY